MEQCLKENIMLYYISGNSDANMQIFNQNCKLKTFDKSNSSDFKINPTGTITTFLLTSNRGLLNLPSHAINPIHNMKMWRP